MIAIETEELCKTYGKGNSAVHATDHVSLSIEKGTLNAIVGKSGSGKSTLLRLLGLQEKQDSGKVKLNGIPVTDHDGERSNFRLHHIGFIWQDYKLIHEYTIKENILIPCYLANQKCNQNHFDEIIYILGLQEILNQYPSACSGGQQQRAAIARAFILKPEIILADEATGNLDSTNAEIVFRLFGDMAKRMNTTVLFGTHDLSLAHRADRIITIKDGKIEKACDFH